MEEKLLTVVLQYAKLLARTLKKGGTQNGDPVDGLGDLRSVGVCKKLFCGGLGGIEHYARQGRKSGKLLFLS